MANLLVEISEDGHNLSLRNKSYLTLFALLLPLAVWAEVKHPPNIDRLVANKDAKLTLEELKKTK